MSNDRVKVKKRPVIDCLSCPLCTKPYKEATTVSICLHTFCKQCICLNLEENENNCCPVCKADLGSFPEELLRPDHNLRYFVKQFFPPKISRRKHELSISPPISITVPEISILDAHVKNALLDGFGMAREIIRRNCDDNDSGKFNIHLKQSLNHSATVIRKQMLCKREPSQAQNRLACPEEAANVKTRTCKTALNTRLFFGTEKRSSAKMKNSKEIRRKGCKSLSMPEDDNMKIEMSKPGRIDVRKSLSSGRKCHRALSINKLPNESSYPIWFCLLAGEEKTDIALPQIQKPYIRTKNGDLTVSFFNKYLVQKLNLKHESEVDVMCYGHSLVPTLTLKDLVDVWVQATFNMGLVYINYNKAEARSKNLVVELTYRRSVKHGTLQ